jgi:hypothetical protein
MLKRFPLGLTFINKINILPYKHIPKKLKWSIIGEFEYNTNQYFILYDDMSVNPMINSKGTHLLQRITFLRITLYSWTKDKIIKMKE